MNTLVCDIGNSVIKTGIYQRNIFKKKFLLKDDIPDLNFLDDYPISSAAISSVVPDKTEALREKIVKKTGVVPFLIDHTGRFNLRINYRTPETVGIDRICSAEGALDIYLEENTETLYNERTGIISIDFGTAITLNFIHYNKIFEGGIIAPGLHMMASALNEKTAQLPLVSASDFEGVIGKSTPSSIAAGIFNAASGMLEKTIKGLVNRYSLIELHIFTTGGGYDYIKNYLDFEHSFVDELVLRGINAIYNINR